MSKGSRNRTKDFKKYAKNYERVFKKMKKGEVKNEESN
jgi:hypothetical protein